MTYKEDKIVELNNTFINDYNAQITVRLYCKLKAVNIGKILNLDLIADSFLEPSDLF